MTSGVFKFGLFLFPPVHSSTLFSFLVLSMSLNVEEFASFLNMIISDSPR